jgi:hypothetical protein
VFVYAIDRKRCPHCVGGLVTVQLDHVDEFDARGPLVFCERCDSPPRAGEPLHVPSDWD